jgi:hypothetical protein
VSSTTPTRRAWHLVHGACVLFPTETPDRGTPQYDASGTVPGVHRSLLLGQRSSGSARDPGCTARGLRAPFCQIPPDKSGSLCLASAAIQTPKGAALASPTDTSGPSDRWPVLVQSCRARSVVRPRTFYARTASSWQGRDRSVGRVRRGELSLSGEPECLSPQAEDSTTDRAALPLHPKGLELPCRTFCEEIRGRLVNTRFTWRVTQRAHHAPSARSR